MYPPVRLRLARSEDAPAIFDLIKQLAEYEKLAHAVVGTIELLREHLFGPVPYARVILAEAGDEAVGMALYFFNYSTFLTRPGIYLEDLFVRPQWRGQGIGRLLLTEVAREAAAAGCGRVEWSVLDWNAPAIGFYQKMGAEVMADWRICRLTGEALDRAAQL